jgi:ribosomal protein S27E
MPAAKQESRTRTRKPGNPLSPATDMLLKCPCCQHPQHIYVYNLNDKLWIKCQACGELSPSGAWTVIAMGNPVG